MLVSTVWNDKRHHRHVGLLYILYDLLRGLKKLNSTEMFHCLMANHWNQCAGTAFQRSWRKTPNCAWIWGHLAAFPCWWNTKCKCLKNTLFIEVSDFKWWLFDGQSEPCWCRHVTLMFYRKIQHIFKLNQHIIKNKKSTRSISIYTCCTWHDC